MGSLKDRVKKFSERVHALKKERNNRNIRNTTQEIVDDVPSSGSSRADVPGVPNVPEEIQRMGLPKVIELMVAERPYLPRDSIYTVWSASEQRFFKADLTKPETIDVPVDSTFTMSSWLGLKAALKDEHAGH